MADAVSPAVGGANDSEAASLALIQKIQHQELLESGAMDDWAEEKRQNEDEDYAAPSSRKRKTTSSSAGGTNKTSKTTNGTANAHAHHDQADVAHAQADVAGASGSEPSPSNKENANPKPNKQGGGGGAAGGKGRSSTGGGAQRRGSSRGTSLLDLIKDGCIQPGEGCLRLVYREHKYQADLTPQGLILFESETFESPSSWSIYVKRRTNPEKKADDGWKSVYYKDKKLEHFKHELLLRMYGQTRTLSAGSKIVPVKKKAKKEKVEKTVEKTESMADKVVEPPMPKRTRPKREIKRKQWNTMDTGDEHSMVPMEEFYGTPGSGEEGAQPFKVEVSSGCAMVMDVHSYMSEKHEIIGLLGGYFDRDSRCVSVEEAFPVRELTTEDDRINVEMDPESEVQVREEIKTKGMVCVGWYHSHPSFPAVPSKIDLKNQLNYQRLVRDEESSLEPFVAGIVSPYNPKTVDLKSDFAWFYVSHGYGKGKAAAPGNAELGDDCFSMSLDVEMKGSSQIISTCMGKVKMLTELYTKKASRTEWNAVWDDCHTLMDKMMYSLGKLLPESWQGAIRDTFLNAIKTFIQGRWEQKLVQTELENLKK